MLTRNPPPPPKPDPYCDVRPIPERAAHVMVASMFAALIFMAACAYLVVRNQYKPFFLEEGTWRCVEYRMLIDIKTKREQQLCIRYDLLQGTFQK